MSVYDTDRESLDRYEFQMGVPRGRLALALDKLTEALILVGQHGVYCQSARQPGKPKMDIQIILNELADAKLLVADVMDEIKRAATDPASHRNNSSEG